jgi:hypothetical protein
MGGIERRMNEAGVASLRSVRIVGETVVASPSLACPPRRSPNRLCLPSVPSMIGGEPVSLTMRQAGSPKRGRRSFIAVHRPTRLIGMRFRS